MINNGSGGCGNDLAIDDIEFKTCGDSTFVEDASNNTGISICTKQTPYVTTLMVVPDNSVFLSGHVYQWQESSDGITWNNIIGETSQSISISGVTNTMYYRSKVSETVATINEALCNTLSEPYQVTVNPITLQLLFKLQTYVMAIPYLPCQQYPVINHRNMEPCIE